MKYAIQNGNCLYFQECIYGRIHTVFIVSRESGRPRFCFHGNGLTFLSADEPHYFHVLAPLSLHKCSFLSVIKNVHMFVNNFT